jgi:hypothetical protein
VQDESDLQGNCTCSADAGRVAPIDRARCHQTDAGVTVLVVIVVEERREYRVGMVVAMEALGEDRRVLQGLEHAFAERVVVALPQSGEASMPRSVGFPATTGIDPSYGDACRSQPGTGSQSCEARAH